MSSYRQNITIAVITECSAVTELCKGEVKSKN